MEVVSIPTPGLGDRSYLVHHRQVGTGIEPQGTLGAAGAAGGRIAGEAENHLPDDDVSGGPELSGQLSVGRSRGYLVTASWIATERVGTLTLTLGEEGAFASRGLGGLTADPHYYAHMAPTYRARPPAIDLPPPQGLQPGNLAVLPASPRGDPVLVDDEWARAARAGQQVAVPSSPLPAR